MTNTRATIFIKKLTAVTLSLIVAVAFVLPVGVWAKDTEEAAQKTVRVGWFESPFNHTDQFGRRSGYAYDYQRKVAAYTGWKYEYVEGSWSELLKKLEKGEIDLMSDVSYTEERAEKMLYPSLPMGTEAYYIFASPENDQIRADDYSTLNGKKAGVNRDSIQKDIFLQWEEEKGVEADIVELEGDKEEALQMLRDGDLDVLVTLDSYGDPKSASPVWKIGFSEFYFVVSKDRPDLLSELDTAMSRIQDENMYYNQRMYEKYMDNSGTNEYLSDDEKKWLARHGKIRVGYQDNYLAFCAKDPETGQLTGALKDFLDYASTGMENAELDFEPVAYPTASDALEALKKGEVDCMFPGNLTEYDSETMGVNMTAPLMRTEMDAVVKASEQKSFIKKDQVTVAVNKGNPNYEMFLKDNYPGWKVKHYKDTPTCLDAVAAGEADCIIISNYRFSNIAKQCEELDLTTVYTGVDMDYCFAVEQGDKMLYSILTKVTYMVPESTANAALTYYSTEDAKQTLWDLIHEHLGMAMSIFSAVLLMIILLLLRSIHLHRRANAEHHLVTDLNRKVFVDSLTSVRNRAGFNKYIDELQERADRGEAKDFAIGIFDCNDLKTVNDEHGHDKGDEYLKAASQVICRVFQHSPVFRIGGDEFAVILENEDFLNREVLVEQFESAMQEKSAQAENDWDQVNVALGIAVYDPRTDRSVMDTATRADRIMYENKQSGKER